MTFTTFARRRRKVAVLRQNIEKLEHLEPILTTMNNATRNWKTTTIGLLTILGWIVNSVLNYLKMGALPSLESASVAWTVGIGFILAKDGDKSGVVRTLLFLPACLALASCSSTAGGEKTFLGITQSGWIKGGKAAVISAAPVLLQERAKTGAKQPVNVQP